MYKRQTPYLALNNIKKAAQAGDSDTVSKYIDYPSVRHSFKDQMNAMMMKEMVNQEDDGFAALGAMLASTMVDKMIDATWDFDDEIIEMSSNTRNEFIWKKIVEASESGAEG